MDARNCDLNERVIPIMGRALRMGCFLQRLHLQSTGLSGRALVILGNVLSINHRQNERILRFTVRRKIINCNSCICIVIHVCSCAIIKIMLMGWNVLVKYFSAR